MISIFVEKKKTPDNLQLQTFDFDLPITMNT